MQDLLVKFLVSEFFIGIEGDLLIGEEHEVVDENLSCLFQGFLWMNRSVGLDLKYQLFIVGLLLNTIVLDVKPYILNRCKDGIHSDKSKLSLGWFVFISRNISASFADRNFHLQFHILLHVADYQFGI